MTLSNDASRNEAGNYIWNSIGGILNAGQSVLVMMVISRALGLEAAGIYSIAFATANLFLYFGNYGVRNFQVSDLREEYSAFTYIKHRLLTTLLMLVFCTLYCAFGYFAEGYSVSKTAVVFAMCVLKAEDTLEEVFEGRLHQRGRLDLAGKLMTLRLIVSIGGMITALYLTRDLLISTVTAAVLAYTSAGLSLVYLKNELRLARGQETGTGTGTAAGLMRECFPVCAANFLSFLLINAPKYAIDAVMDETAQAMYGFIAMPVFVIQLLNMFLYQPLLGRLTLYWNTKNARLCLATAGQVLAGLLITAAACLSGAWLVGIPVLSALYATDLSSLKQELLLLLVGGTFLALGGFLNALLTIARKQNLIPPVYLAGTICSVLLTRAMTGMYGIRGAVVSFVLTEAAVSLILLVLTQAELRKHFE